MMNVRVWSKALTDQEVAANRNKRVILPTDANAAYLKFQLKDLMRNKHNSAFNGTFVKNFSPTAGLRGSNALGANNQQGKAFTLEINAMPSTTNTSPEILFQHAKKYEQGSNSYAGFSGFQLIRDTDQKIAIKLLRVIHSERMNNQVGSGTGDATLDNKVEEVLKTVTLVKWDYQLSQLEEHNIAFHFSPSAAGYNTELFINGESEGVKTIDLSEFLNKTYADLFPFNDMNTNHSASYLGVGFNENLVQSNTIADMFQLSNYYKGYLYDLRLWDTLVNPSDLTVWHRKDIDATHPNFSKLKMNYTMADGAPDIQDHGYRSRKTVRFGDYIRLAHLETNWELCALDKDYESIGGNTVAGLNTTNKQAYWQVMPANINNYNNVKGNPVKAINQIVLKNPFTGKYLNPTNHQLYSQDQLITSASAYAWDIDSLFTADSTGNYAKNNMAWGQYMILKTNTGNNYISSSKKNYTLSGPGKVKMVGMSSVNNYENIWKIVEVISNYDASKMYSQSTSMPVYITLPDFNKATLKNTTLPDGTVVH